MKLNQINFGLCGLGVLVACSGQIIQEPSPLDDSSDELSQASTSKHRPAVFVGTGGTPLGSGDESSGGARFGGAGFGGESPEAGGGASPGPLSVCSASPRVSGRWEPVGTRGFTKPGSKVELTVAAGTLYASSASELFRWTGNVWELIPPPWLSEVTDPSDDDEPSTDDAPSTEYDILGSVPYAAFLSPPEHDAPHKLEVKRFTEGTWENVGSLESTDVAAFSPVLLEISGTTPYIAYEGADGATVRRFDGETWATVETSGFSINIWQLGLFTSETDVYLTSRAYEPPQVLRFDGSEWQDAGPTAVSGEVEAVQFVAGQTSYLHYSDWSRGVKLMRSTGEDWQYVDSQWFPLSTEMQSSIAIVGARPHVAFTQWTGAGDGVGIVARHDGENWACLGGEPFSNDVVWRTSLAALGTTLYVAFSDPTQDQKTTVLSFEED